MIKCSLKGSPVHIPYTVCSYVHQGKSKTRKRQEYRKHRHTKMQTEDIYVI